MIAGEEGCPGDAVLVVPSCEGDVVFLAELELLQRADKTEISSCLTTRVPRRIEQLLKCIRVFIRQILCELTLIKWRTVCDTEAWRDLQESRQLVVKQLNLCKLSEVSIFVDVLAHFVILAIDFEVHPVVKSVLHDFDCSIIVQLRLVAIVSAYAWPFDSDRV